MSAKVVIGITLWYAFNVGYNVYNKTLSSMLAYPYTIATLSMGAGLMYFIPLWMLGIRKAPVLDAIDVKKIAGLATLHSVGHVATVIAMAAGAVSFTHIIKALEPLFSVIFGFIINRKTDPISVNIWLLPIIGGVAWSAVGSQIASGQNIIADINPIAFAGAMGSNVCFSLRGLLSKQVKAEAKSENLTSENLYALITLMSFFLILPFTAILEGDILAANWPPTQKCALADIPAAILGVPTFFKSDSLYFIFELNAWTGFYYYMYNEMAYLVLDEVSATAQAVANTVKRVVILLATVLFLGEDMDMHKAAGAAVAISATMGYSMSKSAAAAAAKK